MNASRTIAALTIATTLIGLPAYASSGATDGKGASHVRVTTGHDAPGRPSLQRWGWIGVGVSAAVVVIKMTIPSVALHPLTRT